MGIVGLMAATSRKHPHQQNMLQRMVMKMKKQEQTPWVYHSMTKDGISDGAYQQGQIKYSK